MRIYQGQKDLMNSSERECLGKRTASRNWFLESPIKWFVLSSRQTCEFFKQDQIQQFSTHYQLRGMASTSLLVNSFLGRTLGDFYSWSHLHTLAENCFAPPSLHSHMCEVEHVNSPRKTAGSVIASKTFRQERKSPKPYGWAHAQGTGDTAELVLGTLRKSPRRPLLRRPEVKAQKWRSANAWKWPFPRAQNPIRWRPVLWRSRYCLSIKV